MPGAAVLDTSLLTKQSRKPSPSLKTNSSSPTESSKSKVSDNRTTKSTKTSTSSKGVATLSVRSVFGGARGANLLKEKDGASARSDSPSSSTEVSVKRKVGSRFGFGSSKTTTNAKEEKPRSSNAAKPPTPTPPVPPTKTKTKPNPSPLGRTVLAPSQKVPSKPPLRPKTPASMKSITTILSSHQDSPGPLSDPTINLVASASTRIMDIEGQTAQDLTAPGDVSFGTSFGEQTPGAKVESDEAEEGDVSALLAVDFGAPTPARPRIVLPERRGGGEEVIEEDEDEDEEEDIDDDNNDDPTGVLETPSRPPLRRGKFQRSVNGLPPTRNNLGYLSPPPASSSSFSRRPRPSNVSSRSKRSSLASINNSLSRSRRSSRAQRPDRGSILTWEAVVERSKEFSEADMDDLGMLSSVPLAALGTMSPGFGTPRYQRLSFGTATTDRDQSRSRHASGAYRGSVTEDGRLLFVDPSLTMSGSEAGSVPGSAKFPPPDSPQGAPPSASALRLSFTPIVPGGRTKEDKHRQVENRLRELQTQLATTLKDVELKEAAIIMLEGVQNQLVGEKATLSGEVDAWRAKEATWVARERDFERAAERHKAREELFEKVEAERVVLSQWSDVRDQAERECERIAQDREVLAVLLSEMNVLMANI